MPLNRWGKPREKPSGARVWAQVKKGLFCGTVSGCQPPEPGRRGSDGLLANLAICPRPVRAALRPLPHCPEPRASPRLLLAVLPADMCFFAHLCLAANVLLAVRPGSPKKTKRSSSLNKWSAKFDSLFTSNTRAFPVMPLTAVPLFAQGIARAAPNSGSGMLAGTMILKP